MVKCGVFFAVRTEFLNIIYTRFGFKELKQIRLVTLAYMIIFSENYKFEVLLTENFVTLFSCTFKGIHFKNVKNLTHNKPAHNVMQAKV
jgi:hypothetical protein